MFEDIFKLCVYEREQQTKNKLEKKLAPPGFPPPKKLPADGIEPPFLEPQSSVIPLYYAGFFMDVDKIDADLQKKKSARRNRVPNTTQVTLFQYETLPSSLPDDTNLFEFVFEKLIKERLTRLVDNARELFEKEFFEFGYLRPCDTPVFSLDEVLDKYSVCVFENGMVVPRCEIERNTANAQIYANVPVRVLKPFDDPVFATTLYTFITRDEPASWSQAILVLDCISRLFGYLEPSLDEEAAQAQSDRLTKILKQENVVLL